MKKRLISTILLISLVLTMFMGVPVLAAGSLSLDKTEYTVNEEGYITVTGVTPEQYEDGTYIALGKKGIRSANADFLAYVGDLPANNVLEFRVPHILGEYEVFLLDIDANVLDKKEFKVVSTQAKPGDIEISKTEAKLNEPMHVIVNGITPGQIENNAWLGIAKWNEKIENTDFSEYVGNLPANNKYEFQAPDRYGKYEIRVFTESSSFWDQILFGSVEFAVVSSKAKPGDITISKTSAQPEEKITVKVNGLTQGEIDALAWMGIARSGEKLENTDFLEYIYQLPAGDVFEFKAPYEPGKYEVRVFCSSGISEPDEFEYALFGSVEFTVGGEPVDELKAGYEGLSSWAVPEVNTAISENLVTDEVLINFPENITREQFCELEVLLYERMTGKKAVPVSPNPFKDTNNPDILKAYNLGIVNGVSADKFAPKNKVTRQEIAVMLVRALKAVMPDLDTSKAEIATKFRDEKDIEPWAIEAVRFMNYHEILKGSGTNGVYYILPKGNTTKEQAIALVLRVFNKFYQI